MSYESLPVGVLALAPPLLAIVLAMYTRQVLVSLFAGVWIGALMIADWNPVAATAVSMDWIVEVVRSPFNTRFLLLIMFMGAGAAFIYKSGGIIALQNWIGHRVNTARDSQILTWLIGVFIFFDSYTSTIVTGNATRELSEENESSREMHAYVLDSTTSPVTTFGPVSNWIGYQVSMIIVGFEAARFTDDERGDRRFAAVHWPVVRRPSGARARRRNRSARTRRRSRTSPPTSASRANGIRRCSTSSRRS